MEGVESKLRLVQLKENIIVRSLNTVLSIIVALSGVLSCILSCVALIIALVYCYHLDIVGALAFTAISVIAVVINKIIYS